MYDGESPKSASPNVVPQRENLEERHGCSASSVLSSLAPSHFWKLKLELKRRRYDISTIQEQSPVVCSPNSGEDGRHLTGTGH